MRTDAKRASDLKYYASPKGRLNRWRKGELDARDDKLRDRARKVGLSVTFTGIDRVLLRAPAVFSGDVREATEWLRSQ